MVRVWPGLLAFLPTHPSLIISTISGPTKRHFLSGRHTPTLALAAPLVLTYGRGAESFAEVIVFVGRVLETAGSVVVAFLGDEGYVVAGAVGAVGVGGGEGVCEGECC